MNNINPIHFKNKVPNDRLKHAIEYEKLDCNKSSIDIMYDSLIENKPAVIENIYSQYRYAGKTAVNIFECIDFPSDLSTKESFLAHLKRKLRMSSVVLGKELRPQITTEPQVNLIEDLDGEILIQWVSGDKKITWDGYEVTEVVVPSFEYMLIRLAKPVFIELRSGFSNHRKYMDALKKLLSKNEEDTPQINWLPVTKVTEAEAEQISSILNAGLVESDVIGDGCISKINLIAAPNIDDLKQQKQYTDMVAGKQHLAQVFHVDYIEQETGYSTKVKFRINHKGGFEFKSKVSERIIKRILDVFVEVRYGKTSSQSGSGSGDQEAV